MAATIENEAPLVYKDSEGTPLKVVKEPVGPQKYVRLKERDGFVISWHPELRLIPDQMEVFESDVPPPEYIPNLVEWMVEQQTKKTEKAVAAAVAAKVAKAAK